MATQHLVKAVILIKRRRLHSQAARRAFSRRALAVCALILGCVSVVAAVAALAALPVYISVTQNLPDIARLAGLLDPVSGALLEPTRLMDRSGQVVLQRLEPESAPRAFVDAISNPYLAAAFIASQEPDYWTADPSTSLSVHPDGIAERLVARLLLAGEPEGWPKTWRARLLAAEAIQTYGRAQILNWALNSTTFGNWTFGVESASQLYFGRPAISLSLPEIALLAAVAQAPALNPFDTPELALAYQQLVLGAMHDRGFISQAEYQIAVQTPVVFAAQTGTPNSPNQQVLAELEASLGAERLQSGGVQVVTPLDSALQSELARLAQDAAVEAVVLDPLNGHVLAMTENALRTDHSIGDLNLPFIYLDEFAQGKSPASLVWLHGSPTTLRAALAHQEMPQEDMQLDQKVAEALGFDVDGGDLAGSLLDVASAYGVLVNGYLASHATHQASTLLFASDSEGRVLSNNTTPHLEAITSPELAFLVTDVLADASVRDLPATIQGRQFAYFTSDDWIVGYSPQRVVVVWSENKDDARVAWSTLFEAAHRSLPVKNWDVPAGLSSVIVCVPSGMLADDDCPETRREWFLAGTEPRQRDTLFQRVALNRLNGRLATVFTPQEFVEERVFLIAPQGVRSTIEQPPDDYDTIPAFAGQTDAVTIASPGLFAEVEGTVQIVGFLNANASAYDIQVGQGLWPTEWFQIAQGDAPRNRRVSFRWDASELSGLWSIQLQAWDEEGTMARSYTIITFQP